MKCPGCEAFINPAWDRCHACGGALKGAAFIETVKPDTPGPVTEADFQRIADRHGERVARLTPNGTGELIAEHHAGLHRRIEDAAEEVNRLWVSCQNGERLYPDAFPAFVAAVRAWCRLSLQAARYVRLLDKGIRCIYSHKLKGWLYIVWNKAAIEGVRLRPAGAVYTVEECATLLTVNPGADALRTLHEAKITFDGELLLHASSVDLAHSL